MSQSLLDRPAVASATATSEAVFGQSWHEYSPPSVLHWFTPHRLASLLAKFGLQEVARGRPAKWINAGHTASLLKHKLSRKTATRWLSKPLGLLPDKLALPYVGDDLFWGVYRKNVKGFSENGSEVRISDFAEDGLSSGGVHDGEI